MQYWKLRGLDPEIVRESDWSGELYDFYKEKYPDEWTYFSVVMDTLCGSDRDDVELCTVVSLTTGEVLLDEIGERVDRAYRAVTRKRERERKGRELYERARRCAR